MERRDYQRNLENQVEERTAQLADTLKQLEQSYDDTLEALGGALDLKDAETEGHSKRVTAYTIAIAKAMNVDAMLLPQIARAAFLHDIGKMAISDQILRKPGPLTPEEREVMRTHCDIGFNMVTRISFLREAAEIVLSHQEYFDGSGYPRGLKQEEIPLGARIFAVADALDAMISDRPYRKALSITHAQEEIKRCAGTQFDPKVVEVFLDHAGDALERIAGKCRKALPIVAVEEVDAGGGRKTFHRLPVPFCAGPCENRLPLVLSCRTKDKFHGIGSDQDGFDDGILRLHPRLL